MFVLLVMQDYDIVIWSATSMKWIEEKMKLLGVTSNTSYKIAFYLDSLAMISVHTPKYGVVQVSLAPALVTLDLHQDSKPALAMLLCQQRFTCVSNT